MVSMDDMLDSEKVLAWLWVIEAMASFKEVGPSLLHDLVQSAPELPDDLGKNTREMVALRCLEDVIAPQNGITHNVSSAKGSKVQFDLSESCEDVLQRILQESSVSNLRVAGPELLKWDIQPFILHKRACMPKCALEQLKDAILDGTHPYADFLREKSGLASTSQDDGIFRNGNNRDSVTSACSDVQNKRVGTNSDPSIIENRINQLGDNVLPSKRHRLAAKDMAGIQENCNATNNLNVEHINFKRAKQHASSANESAEQNSVPLRGREPLKDSSEMNVPGSTIGHDLTESEMGTMDDGRILEDRCNECTVTNWSQQSKNNSFHENLSEVPCSSPQMPQDTSRVEAHQNLSADEAQEVNKHGARAQPNGASQSLEQDQVSLHGKQPLEDSSERDFLVTVEEHMDLEDGCDGCTVSKGSQQVDNGESLENDSEVPHNAPEPSGAPAAETAHKIPMKESKRSHEHDFQFQESNSASSDRFLQGIIAGEAEHDTNICGEAEMSSDNEGYSNEMTELAKKKLDFLSSQCTDDHDSMLVDWTEQNLCMRCNEGGQLLVCNTNNCQLVVHEKCLGCPAAIDNKGNFYCPFCAYSLAIEDYLEAKKSSSLARKELAAFIRMGSEHQLIDDADGLNKKTSHYTGGSEDEVFLGKTPENEQVGERGQNVANQVKTNVNKDNNLQCQNVIVNNQESGHPSACNGNVNVEHGEERTSADRRLLPVSAGEKEGEEKSVQDCQSERTEGEQGEVPGKSDNVAHANTDTDIVNQGKENLGIQWEVLKGQDVDTPKRCVYEFDIKSGDDDDDDDESNISKYCIRLREREISGNFPGTPRGRRKKLPWTEAEEEKLKEGIQKFSDERKIPWKKILEFGESVFLKGRSTVDLKDKWRNLCKGTPKK